MFELTREEYTALRSQFATLETGRGKYSKFVPFAFTEQGVAMLSSVLNSAKAIQVNISIIRAFVAVRKHLTDHKDLQLKIEALEASTDQRFKDVYDALDFMINTQTERTLIGFKRGEEV
jgi:post-segregation antitoxin (ccd killing protein)